MKKFKFLIFAMGVMLFVLSLSFNVVFAETNDCYTITQEDGDVFQVVLVDDTTAKVYDMNGISTGETFTYVFLEEDIIELTDGEFVSVCTATKSEFYVKEETNPIYTGGDESCTYVVELLDESQCKVVATATNGNTITIQGSYLLEGELLQINAGEGDSNPLVFVVGENNTLEFYDDYADIPEDNEEIIEDEKPTFREMAKAFCDKWLQVIISGISGISGTALILWIGRKILAGIKNKIADSVNLNDEERKKNIEQLEKMENTLDNAINKLRENDEKTQQLLTNVENMSKDYKTLLENYAGMVEQIGEFKKLIALLISSNPDLASNGYAKKILETLDEGNDVE